MLVLLDADELLLSHLALAQAAYLADNDPSVPPLIVVGIFNGADRIHDMTPRPSGSSVAEFPTGGGAADFADFILGELLPRVRADYRTLPTTILAGHSASGLFALDVAASRPGSFQGIIAISPALWYSDHAPAVAYADVIGQSTVPQRIFVATGGEAEADIDTTTRHFVERLTSAKKSNVALGYRRYADDTHSMTPLSGMPDGLRFVFEPLSPRVLPISSLDIRAADSATIAAALDTSERAYAEAARGLLMPTQLSERIVNRVGYQLLNSKRPSLAVWLFRRNVSNYAESVNTYDSLADGLLVLGDTAGAISELRRAVNISRRTGAPLPNETSRKLARLLRRSGHTPASSRLPQ